MTKIQELFKFSCSFLILLVCALECNAQQPFLKFKPRPSKVDSFDLILSMAPFQLLALKGGLAMDMRLHKNRTVKIAINYRNMVNPPFIELDHPIFRNRSSSLIKSFDEQGLNLMFKHYKVNKKSRIYFGPYIGYGIELRRAHVIIQTEIANFEPLENYCSTKRQSLFFSIGTTKLISENIIFDVNTAISYQFKPNNSGECIIQGLGYKHGFGSFFSLTLGWPLGHNKTIKL